MSDLHRAIRDRSEAFRPELTPPFAALQARRRRRDQRRAGAAVALAALAVVGVTVVPGALGTRSQRHPDALAQAQARPEFIYSVTWEPRAYDPAVYRSLEHCFALPGLSGQVTFQSLPPQDGGRIAGRTNADAFRRCVADRAPGADVEITPARNGRQSQTGAPVRPRETTSPVGRPPLP